VSKPSELAVTMATLSHRYTVDGWLYASQVAANLRLLGFDVTGRQVGSYLARMARADAPWVERRRSPFDDFEYRVTHYGRNDIDNRFPGVSTRIGQVGA
jgi:hypothetical protein